MKMKTHMELIKERKKRMNISKSLVYNLSKEKSYYLKNK